MPSGPIEFLNVRIEQLTDARAVARFETNYPSSCEAIYGTAADALDNTATDPDMPEGELSEDHTVPLEDLAPTTRYYWRAKATNADSEEFTSELFEFETLAGDASAGDAAGSLWNVALAEHGTTITAVSSNFGGGDLDSSWGGNNTIDGKMATEWATNGDGDGAFIELDFGQERQLNGFGFRSRMMTDGTSIIERVELRFESTTLGPFDTPDPDELYVFQFDAPVSSRSVRVEAVQTTGGNTGAKEIQFLSADSDTDVKD